MRRVLVGLGVLCLATVPLAATRATAKGTPAQLCQASQLRAASRFLRSELGCFADYHKNPAADPGASAVLPACRASGAATFTSAFEDAVATAGPNVCTQSGPAAGLVDDLQLEVDDLELAVSGDFEGTEKAERTLHAALSNATGAALAAALNAESANAKQADEAKRLASRSKARAKLSSSFSNALAKADGIPYTGLSSGALTDEVDRIVDELAAASAPQSHSVAGTIQAAEGSITDSDVNDPNTPPVPNDSPATAQSMPVPAALGGYVNLPGVGPAGNSQFNGDPSDFFRVSLAAGQRVNLRFADPETADLDLCLYLAANPFAPIDCSLGVSETEELVAFSSGEFLIEVFAFSGCACGSSYVLTVGQVLASAGANGLRLSDEFVPGEVIVTLADAPARLAAGPPAAATAYAASLALTALGGAADREMLFRVPAAAAERTASFEAHGLGAARAALEARFAGVPGPQREKLDTLLAVKALHRRVDVAIAEPNFVRRAQLVPNDPFVGLQWHYPLINLPAAWDLTTGDANIEVAVIDTGVLFDHPDLDGQLSNSFDFDFVSDPSRSVDGNGIDDDAEDPGDGGGVQLSSFHGTHVAGTIGARTDNGSGVAGVAWNVTLIPLRALGLFGSGTNYDVLQAVRYAAGLPNDSGSSHLVDVINLSLGGSGFSATEQSVFTEARNAGVIVVAAAGNNNSSQLFYPASYDGVISVSAVDLRGLRAPYSNFGVAVDVAAPGGDTSVDRNGDGYADGVLSTLFDEGSENFGFVFYQGTSMASPHVAGVAALMKAVKPSLAPLEFETLLSGGALTTDLGTPGRDDVFGHGLIDARKAVEAVSQSTSDDPILLVGPSGLNLGTTQTQASIQVSNGGGGTLSITSVTDDQPWLAVSPASTDVNGLGGYAVSVDRSGLANGTYTGTLSVASSAGNASVSVVMSVTAGAASADAGFHYVLILDPVSSAVVAQFDVSADEGAYLYSLSAVPSGLYLLYAGSDTDNNFFICGTGEACGAYPTLGTPEPIELTNDRTGLDFVTGFLQTIGSSAASGGAPLPPAGLRRLRSRQLAR